MADDTRRRTLTFSSEYRVQRWFGVEILDHGPKSVRMGFINSGRAPLLMGHDQRMVIGKIETASLDTKDKKGRATARFGRNAMASDALRDVDDEILVNVSTGYRVHEMVLEKQTDAEDTYRITDWEPLEASLVGIPADPSVGMGRSEGDVATRSAAQVSTPTAQVATGVVMAEQVTAAAGNSAENVRIEALPQSQAALAAQNAAGQNGPNAVEFEKQRRRAIETLCKANRLDEKTQDYWIRTGLSLDQVADDMLRILEERGRTNPQSVTKLDLTGRETQKFSLLRMIQATYDKDFTNAGFELECSREIAKRLGKVPSTTTFYVPFDVQQRAIPVQQRDLTVATAGAGGFLVETENQGFIEILRNRSVALRMGATRLNGLVGSVTVPRQSVAATPVWLANEASTATESQQTFVQMALSPKTVSSYTEISRQLTLQSSPAAEGIVTSDLAAVVAIAADLGVLNGSGASGQPTGIIGTAGIGGVTGTSLAYAGIIEFQTDVATANVTPSRGGYVTTPAVAGLMVARQRFTSTDTPLWTGNIWDGQMSGFPAMSSNQMPAANMLFGDWSEVVLAEWGVLEVSVNPFANFQAAIIGVRALYTIDVGVRRPFAFSLASSIT